MKAVILAGGRGTRLRPYTVVFPKPLMPIGDEPILEIVIKQLRSHGFHEINMAVGHLAELISVFFGNGEKYGMKINYFREDKPLGTAGPLAQMSDELNETFLMMNGDVLTTLNYSELVKFHKKSDAIATVALYEKNVQIDFGLVELDEERNIRGYTEKPMIDYLVSMGVYVFSSKVMEYIESNQYLDFPDLIKLLIENGEKVKGYIYDGYWLDMGRPGDYELANHEIGDIYSDLFKD